MYRYSIVFYNFWFYFSKCLPFIGIVMKETPPLRICIISPLCYPLLCNDGKIESAGGAEAQLLTLGMGLSEMGNDVHYIVGNFGQPKKIKIKDTTVHKADFRYLGGSNFFIIIDWIKLFFTFYMIDADVYLMKLPKDLILLVGLYCKIFNKKLVYVGQSDKDTHLPFIFKTQNKISVFFYAMGLAFVDNVFSQNKSQFIGFTKLGCKCKIIPNVITLQKSDESKADYILWVGNSSKNKQPEKFLELAEKFPNYSFKMIMAPCKQGQSDGHIKEFAEKNKNFEYIGFIPFSKIHKYFSGACIFVNTSLKEGFPNVFIQSWQYKTPVISLNIDPDGVIREYDMGMCSGSFDRLCSDLSNMMKNKYLRKIKGENAYLYVMEKHSLCKILFYYNFFINKLFKK